FEVREIVRCLSRCGPQLLCFLRGLVPHSLLLGFAFTSRLLIKRLQLGLLLGGEGSFRRGTPLVVNIIAPAAKGAGCKAVEVQYIPTGAVLLVAISRETMNFAVRYNVPRRLDASSRNGVAKLLNRFHGTCSAIIRRQEGRHCSGPLLLLPPQNG